MIELFVSKWCGQTMQTI